jgi:hypothetical protein
MGDDYTLKQLGVVLIAAIVLAIYLWMLSRESHRCLIVLLFAIAYIVVVVVGMVFVEKDHCNTSLFCSMFFGILLLGLYIPKDIEVQKMYFSIMGGGSMIIVAFLSVSSIGLQKTMDELNRAHRQHMKDMLKDSQKVKHMKDMDGVQMCTKLNKT